MSDTSHFRQSVIVAGARTPIGRLLGGLKDLSAADLGGVAIKGALEKAGVSRRPGRLPDHGPGHPGRRRAEPRPHRRQSPRACRCRCPSITINKVCLSGLNAIAMADQLIRAGEVEIVVAGGMESMTNAPHLLPKSREGFKYGDTTLVDSMAYDALFDQVTQQAMGAAHRGVQRRRAATSPARSRTSSPPRSHQTAAEAWKNGLFDDEVVPVAIPQRRGDPVVVTHRRGRARRHHRRVAVQAAPGVQQGRHHHRRLGVPDLRRRLPPSW